MSTKKTPVKVEKSPDWRQIYAIGATGGHTPFDFRIGFYNDFPEFTDNGMIIKRLIATEIILSPVAAKSLATWLVQHIKEFESKYGEIRLPMRDNTTETNPDLPKSGMWT